MVTTKEGNDDLDLALLELIPENESLLSYELISKITILVSYSSEIQDQSSNACFTHLANAVGTARNELAKKQLLKQISDIQNINENEIEKKIRNTLDTRATHIAHLNAECEDYMRHLAKNVATNIRRNPKDYNAYRQNINLDDKIDMDYLSSEERISEVLADKNIPKRTRLGIEKYYALRNAMHLLNNNNIDTKTRLDNFCLYYEKIKPIIAKRRDTAGNTFLKVMGTILSLGIFAPLLWSVQGGP